MKLKVGDYVRTNKGTIDKLTDKNIMTYEVALMGFGEKPIKSSPNIIDLIKVGDYVNGFLVNFVGNDGIEVFWYKDETQWLEQDDIKSIVTKEQFEQMEYRIGEDEL